MSGRYSAIRVSGGLLPDDIRSAIVAGSAAGLTSTDFHLGGERPREAAARTWAYLQGVYRRFRDDLDRLPAGDPAVGLTRERWLSQLFSALDYGRLPLTVAGGITVDDRAYGISHLWGATPIHLLGWGVPLDKRSPGVAGAAQRAPHALLQDLLNRSEDHLWGMVSNGRELRLLRDSTSLTGQAFVAFDLETIFDGDLFADYAQLYLLAHQSRVEINDGASPADCWLERWRTAAVNSGVRALDLLRMGVQHALGTLGTGFLQHPANADLRTRLATGEVTVADMHANLLRIVYRLLFWSVAEDRQALLDPGADAAAAQRYHDHFSSARLRAFALRRRGSTHHDLWESVSLVMTALSRIDGEPRLGLPGLGGLFSVGAAEVLAGARLGNRPLLAAVRSLSVVQPKGQPRRTVDFANLGAEELGSIYESLLELVPRRDPLSETFTLETAAGNDRKTSGSYYTPTDLVDLVLDTALDPVLDDAEKRAAPGATEQALLAVTVCDPAIGSGHFMVAAARRIAIRLAMARTGEVDPTPTMLADAMHDVVARCIYGVDINPMAADLAKVSLWLEAMTPGRPLSFLDHHIKVGNALLGTTPALLAGGIPDAAYVRLTGDDATVVRGSKKQNIQQRIGQGQLFDDNGFEVGNEMQRSGTVEVAERAASAMTLADVAWAAQRYATLQASPDVVRARRVADAWCAAFLGPKVTDAVPITQDSLAAIEDDRASAALISQVAELAARHRLFHWHLEFPEVFRVSADGPAGTDSGWVGGFSAMLGNPPWERVKLQEQEFFAARDPEIANAAHAAARKKAIAALVVGNPDLAVEFEHAKRQSEAESHFLRASGRFPLCGVGDVNTYSVFAEHFRTCLAVDGRSGIVTPTGLATDATTAAFFADSLRTQRLVAFYDFENEAKIFGGVHNQFRFAVSCLTGGETVPDVRMAFYTRYVSDVPARRFALASNEIAQINPNTGTLPIFRTRRDADITLACYRRHPVLIKDDDPDGNPWGLRFGTLFHMANDSGLFRTAANLAEDGASFDGWAWADGVARWLPLYESKMLSHWNHRYATYANATEAQLNKGTLPRLAGSELDNPEVEPLARYWVAEADVVKAIPNAWDRSWLLGFRRLTRSSDLRTLIPFPLPRAAVGDNAWTVVGKPEILPKLLAILSSLVADYLIRQKLSGTTLSAYIVEQLSVPTPDELELKPSWLIDTSFADFLAARSLELVYTSDRMLSLARDLHECEQSRPFHWLPDRRAQLIAEIDAAMFHLYGLDRADVDHVIDSFPVVRKYEERDFGEFRTKRLVLAEYDAMTRASETGVPYRSPLDPAPGYGHRHEE